MVAQNSITVVSEGTTISIAPNESKMQTEAVQPVQIQKTLPAINSQREDEIHVQIRAKKTELENSADNVRKATLNDEIQQLQDELKIIQNPPVQIHKDPVLPDLN
ncbi:MAG: hypothetical protein A2W93_06205 [Bacteroidetes bacterium GWF2_43_63]|nr:MAG: hypothetical protein A2W94_08330 [Bacteroidetes bacterium GWE2_42_42]OFY53213.1 MAG: hypothetical protein A2W93_06205 [Bacteroidetes bacterium GWF2_43_63]HBG71795.1 hypothetical protein [Bacteroidales bacterium]HCB61540.1 hypothetical protein [Bacteroidales bacterium]HCY22752.1 hypothetical protein [Bacteroidales bacterium]